MKKSQTMKKTVRLVETALLSAIVLVMAFTPLGYLKTAGLEVTFIMIPVVVGAIVAGPTAGAILGAVFGATSFFQCFGMSAFGATLLNINPVFTFIVCVPTRILAGWLTGVVAKALSKSKHSALSKASVPVASLAGPILNTLFFMSAIVLLFGRTEYIMSLQTTLGATNILMFVVLFVGVQGLVEAAVCFVASSAVALALKKALKNRF